MSIFFAQILNMSLTASIAILCVMAARLLLKRVPKIYSYALWAVVLFRLLCPVSLAAPVSVLEVTKPQTAQVDGMSYVAHTPVEYVLVESGEVMPREKEEPVSVQELQERQADTTPSVMDMVSYIWLAGIAIMLLRSAAVYLELRRNLVGAMLWRGEVYLADHIDTPFVMGVLRPRIYLPSGIPAQERRYIIAHERHHIRRGDHIIKLLAYFALCIHWFNPLVWAAFVLAGKDMEMSCDEAVLKRLGADIRADYSASLLRLATHRTRIAGTPLAFGEGDTKGRVLNMAKWKKPKLWVSVLCVIMCIGIALACALNPEEEKSLGEMTRWEGPSSCGVGDLNYYLPEGCAQESVDSLELSDWELRKALEEKQGMYPYNVIFTEGETTVGGINSYYLPESVTPANFDWIENLGLWEFEDETLGHFAGSGIEYAWEVEFFTDLPGDVPDEVLRKHYFFLSEDMTMVYDLWFDMLTVDNGIYRQILDSCVVGGGSHKQVATTQMFLDFEVTLPDSFILLIDDSNTRKIATANTIVGGITAYERPDFELKFSSRYPLEEWNVDEWLAAMGFEEDTSLAYMGGGSIYGDFERHYSSDVSEGQPITEDRLHTFFIREQFVYDVWFDRLEIDENVADGILKSIAHGQEPAGTEPTAPAETAMFERDFTSNDGTVNISITANIPDDLGNAGAPVLEAVPHYITEEEVQRIAYAIFGEDAQFIKAAPRLEQYTATQAQLRDAIERSSPYTTAEAWEELTGSEGAHGSSCQELAQRTRELIAYWESSLENFRCDYPEEPCDWTYQNDAYAYHAPGNASDESVAESGESINAWVEMDGYSYRYKVTTRNKDDFKINNVYVTMEWPVSNSELDLRVPYKEHCTVEPTDEQVVAAKVRVYEMLDKMGLGYWIVDEAYVEVHTYNNKAVPEYVIKLSAVPVVEGIPAIRWGQHSNINTKSADAPVDNYYLPMAEFRFAADGTLMGMDLMSPMDETVTGRTDTGWSNESLLAQAEEELKKININGCGMDVDSMGYSNVRCDVDISNIRVGMARIRVAGTDAAYRYVPALALYGNRVYTFENGDTLGFGDRPANLLTLNALDGSVITNLAERFSITE